MKDVKTILLILVSLCLLGTWVFHIYDKTKYASVSQNGQPSVSKDKTAANDSIQTLYKTTVAQLETVIVRKDSINKELKQKATEIDTLRNEINRMLNETNLTKEDLRKAMVKIQELQLKINQFNSRQNNTTVAAASTVTNPQPVSSSNSKTQMNPSVAEASFSAGDMALQAVKNNAGDGTHFSISFQLKNMTAVSGTASVYIVVRDPMGNTVQDDEWIAGVFTAKAEGTKKYSRRLNWDFAKSESRRFTTTVPVKSFTDGTYQLQVYCNGVRLGKADVTLN